MLTFCIRNATSYSSSNKDQLKSKTCCRPTDVDRDRIIIERKDQRWLTEWLKEHRQVRSITSSTALGIGVLLWTTRDVTYHAYIGVCLLISYLNQSTIHLFIYNLYVMTKPID